jgi:uncharacterized protein (TIGR03083 family)
LNKDEILRSVTAQRRTTLSFLRNLDPGQFDTPTALPGWRLREVAAHLITTDRAAVTGTILPAVLLAGSTDKVEAWNERQVPKWANRPVPDLLIGLDRWGRRFVRLARILPAVAYRPRIPSPWGRGPAGIYIWVRTYDEWVHRQDMRRALGMPDEDVDLDSVSEFLLTAIGLQTIRRLDGAEGGLAIEFDGVPISEWRYDLANKSFGPRGPQPSWGGEDHVVTRIVAPGAPFIMAAAGRDSFEDLRSKGIIRVEGDEEVATRLLSKLRIV